MLCACRTSTGYARLSCGQSVFNNRLHWQGRDLGSGALHLLNMLWQCRLQADSAGGG